MREGDRYIPGVPCWVDTSQPDPEAAVAFYSELFGWELEDADPQGATFIASKFVPENRDLAAPTDAAEFSRSGASNTTEDRTVGWVDLEDGTFCERLTGRGPLLGRWLEPGWPVHRTVPQRT